MGWVATLDKRGIANLLKKAPWTGYAAQAVYRLWQERITAGVVGAIFDADGRLLIVEHVFHPKLPWGLPGGWMNRNEEPGETIQREIREETGLMIEVVKPLLIARTPFLRAHLDIAYLCKLLDSAAPVHLSGELLAHEWVNPLSLPPMANFHARVVKAAIAERKAYSDKDRG